MVQVTVSEGILEGELVENEYGGNYYSFKGIPFAEPPVGNLRFKAPQPPQPWSGIRSALEFGPICCQVNMFRKRSGARSEDCLYLNVYTPDTKPDKLLPVMFYVHGGAFVCGSGNDDFYGPELLVRQNVILVSFNYRLEILGFLCLDTEDIPGNAGMKDQVAALRWVNKNIKNFGGDSNKITIFGESAGGASVSWLLSSPMTKGLFKRAIAQSGASTCWWSQTYEPRERALALARKLGCYSEDDKDVARFFLSQPVESLIDAQAPITLAEKAKSIFEPTYVIVKENKFGDNERFFYGDIYSDLKNGVHDGVEVITGYTEDEGLLNIAFGPPLEEKLKMINNFHEYVVPNPIMLSYPINELIKIGKKIKQFYFNNKPVRVSDWEQVVKYYSLEVFVYGTILWAKICSSAKKNKIFMYKFSCKSERNVLVHNTVGMGNIIGSKPVVCHGDDILYLFTSKFFKNKIDKDSKTFQLVENVTKLWTNFAKYGDPTPDDSLGVKWSPYSVENQNYLNIGNQLVAGVEPDSEEVQFWEDLFREYAPLYVHN